MECGTVAVARPCHPENVLGGMGHAGPKTTRKAELFSTKVTLELLGAAWIYLEDSLNVGSFACEGVYTYIIA